MTFGVTADGLILPPDRVWPLSVTQASIRDSSWTSRHSGQPSCSAYRVGLSPRIWDARDYEEIGILRGHRGIANFARFSVDGTRMSRDSRSNVRQWPIADILSSTTKPDSQEAATVARGQRHPGAREQPKTCLGNSACSPLRNEETLPTLFQRVGSEGNWP